VVPFLNISVPKARRARRMRESRERLVKGEEAGSLVEGDVEGSESSVIVVVGFEPFESVDPRMYV
jgi:hypothetical protein